MQLLGFRGKENYVHSKALILGQVRKQCMKRLTKAFPDAQTRATPKFGLNKKTPYPDLGFQTTIPGYTYRNEWQKEKAKGLAPESKGDSESNSIMAGYSFRQLTG
ncbi:unnamed protein product [Sphenostylis stenocarpa]|uniref:Uncharacterized protein n=1 Tax=Sphenostylis stenocarpa TaxID=92480 RepID=A0AA86VKW8_9FABA|nr:unnamed protein product [Sphenostylis stenocarpa]